MIQFSNAQSKHTLTYHCLFTHQRVQLLIIQSIYLSRSPFIYYIVNLLMKAYIYTWISPTIDSLDSARYNFTATNQVTPDPPNLYRSIS